MTIIDNDKCLLMICELYEPIKNYFNLEESHEILEVKEISEADAIEMFECLTQANAEKGRMFKYVQALTHDVPGKDLMFVILSELYLYLNNQRNYTINHWQLCREFEKIINYEQNSKTVS